MPVLVKNFWTLSVVWAGALVNHPSWMGRCIEKLFKIKNSLKQNAASHISWYSDTDGFLDHSPSRGSLYYKEPTIQEIILGFFVSLPCIYLCLLFYICMHLTLFSFLFLNPHPSIYFLLIPEREDGERERERGREREKKTLMWETNIDLLPPACTMTGDWTWNPGMCSDWGSNPKPLFGMQDNASTNWATCPGLHRTLECQLCGL